MSQLFKDLDMKVAMSVITLAVSLRKDFHITYACLVLPSIACSLYLRLTVNRALSTPT